MRIKLASDFIDYYDHHFDVTDVDATFSRKTTDGPDRITMLRMLQSMGFDVPNHGIISRIYDGVKSGLDGLTPEEEAKFFNGMEFVVYTDLHAHAGEGKVKLNLKEAFEKHPDCFATSYLKTNYQGHGQSLRLLVVGEEQFWLQYTSRNDWRSNAGDCEITIPNIRERVNTRHIKVPLFAIDFLPAMGRHGKVYAVDFNVSPGIRGTPIEEILPAERAAQLIKDKIAALASGW